MNEMKECAYEPCQKTAASKGYCSGHYQQQRRGKELTPLEAKVKKPNESYCLTCKTQKAREDFYMRPNGTLQHECKNCAKARAQARRDKTAAALQRLAELEGV